MIRSTLVAFATRPSSLALVLGTLMTTGCGGPNRQSQSETTSNDPPAADQMPGNSTRSDSTLTAVGHAPADLTAAFADPNVLVEPHESTSSSDAGSPRGPVPTELAAGVTRRAEKTVQWATWLNAQRGSDQRCGRRVVGPCVVYDCRGSTQREGSDRVRGVNLGPVVIYGDAAGLALYPDGEGRYAPVEKIDLPTWAPGDSVRFEITGDSTVPMALGDLVFPPALAHVVLPARDADGAMPLDRSAPFAVAWDAVDGEVGVVIRESDGTATPGLDDLMVMCSFAGAQGSGVIPTDAIQSLLPSGSIDRPVTTLQVGRRVTKIGRVATLPVRISLIDSAETPVSVR